MLLLLRDPPASTGQVSSALQIVHGKSRNTGKRGICTRDSAIILLVPGVSRYMETRVSRCPDLCWFLSSQIQCMWKFVP